MKRLYQTLTLLLLVPLFFAFQTNLAHAGDACNPNPCPPTRPKCTVISGGAGRVCNSANQVACGDPGSDGQCGLAGGCAASLRCKNTTCTPDPTCDKCIPVGDGCGVASGCPIGTRCLSNGLCSPDNYCQTPTNNCNFSGGCGPDNGCLLGQTCTSGTCHFLSSCPGSNTGGGGGNAESIFGTLGNFFAFGEDYSGTVRSGFFSLLYKAILPLAVIIGALLVAGAGYTLMTSQGDPQRAMEGKEQLTSAIMGLLFALLGAGILRVIISTLIEGTDPGF